MVIQEGPHGAGKLAAIFRQSLVPILNRYPDDIPLDIIRRVELSASGDFVDTVEVMASGLAGRTSWDFYWHVPRLNNRTEVAAVDIDSDFPIDGMDRGWDEKLGIWVVWFRIRKPTAVDHLRGRVTLLMKGMAFPVPTKGWRRPYFRTIRFPFAFVPAASVVRYELRVIVPSVTKWDYDSSLGGFSKVELSEHTVLVAAANKGEIAAMHGTIDVRQRRPEFNVTAPGLVLAATTASIAMLQVAASGRVFYTLSVVCLLAGVYLLHRLYRG